MKISRKHEEDFLKFMEELERISNKYGFGISGCGCCGSPFIVKLDPSKKYVYNYVVGKFEDGIEIIEVSVKCKPTEREDFKLTQVSISKDEATDSDNATGIWQHVSHGPEHHALW
ncbi:MAG: hypothetical protein GXO48_05050 [Chlorobi bacterium]|nr:hypothetical protein [Chlorobiota bacterium]